MKELFCSLVLNTIPNISCCCIANINSSSSSKRFLVVDDKGVIVYPSIVNNCIQLSQCILPIASSLKVLGIYSIDDVIILSSGPDKNDRYHLLLYKNNNSSSIDSSLSLTLVHDLSIVYKPIDIIKYIYQNIMYITVASIDGTLHVYELDSLGRLSRSANRSTIRSLCERRIGLNSVNQMSSNSLILRLIKNDDDINDDIIVAAYSNGYVCYDYIKQPRIQSYLKLLRGSSIDWFHGESPRDIFDTQKHYQGHQGHDIDVSRNNSLDSSYHDGNGKNDNIDIIGNGDVNIVVNDPTVNQKLLLFEGAVSCICFYNINTNTNSINMNDIHKNTTLNSMDNLNISCHSYLSSSPDTLTPGDNRSDTWKSVLGLSIPNTNSFTNTLSICNQLSMESIGSDSIHGNKFLIVGSTSGAAALLSLDDSNSNPIPIPGAKEEHGGVQAVALGENNNGTRDIYVGYSDGTVIRASIVYNNTTTKSDDINTIRKFEFTETWRFQVPFPILSVAFGKLCSNNSSNFVYQSNHLIVMTTVRTMNSPSYPIIFIIYYYYLYRKLFIFLELMMMNRRSQKSMICSLLI